MNVNELTHEELDNLLVTIPLLFKIYKGHYLISNWDLNNLLTKVEDAHERI